MGWGKPCVARAPQERRESAGTTGGERAYLPAGNRYAVLPCWYYMASQYRVCTSASEGSKWERGRARGWRRYGARVRLRARVRRALSLLCVCVRVDVWICVCVCVCRCRRGVTWSRRCRQAQWAREAARALRAASQSSARRACAARTTRREREREIEREEREGVCIGRRPTPALRARRRGDEKKMAAVECRVRECLARPADGRDAIEQQVIGVRSADSRRAQQRSARERGRESASQQSERQATQGAERQVQCFLLWRADSETGACAPRGITGAHRATAARERSRPCRLLSLPFFLREREKEGLSRS